MSNDFFEEDNGGDKEGSNVLSSSSMMFVVITLGILSVAYSLFRDFLNKRHKREEEEKIKREQRNISSSIQIIDENEEEYQLNNEENENGKEEQKHQTPSYPLPTVKHKRGVNKPISYKQALAASHQQLSLLHHKNDKIQKKNTNNNNKINNNNINNSQYNMEVKSPYNNREVKSPPSSPQSRSFLHSPIANTPSPFTPSSTGSKFAVPLSPTSLSLTPSLSTSKSRSSKSSSNSSSKQKKKKRELNYIGMNDVDINSDDNQMGDYSLLPHTPHYYTNYIEHNFVYIEEELKVEENYQQEEITFTVLYTPKPKPKPIPPPTPTPLPTPSSPSPSPSSDQPSPQPPSTSPFSISPTGLKSSSSSLSLFPQTSPLANQSPLPIQPINQTPIANSNVAPLFPNQPSNQIAENEGKKNSSEKSSIEEYCKDIYNRAEIYYTKYREGVPNCTSQDIIRKRLNQITGSFESAHRNANFLKAVIDKSAPSQRKACVIFIIDNLIKSSGIAVNKRKYHRCAITILKLLNDMFRDLTVMQYLVACLYHNSPYLIPFFNFGEEKKVIGGENEHSVLARMYFSLLLLFFNEKTPLFFTSDDLHNHQQFKSGSYVSWKFLSAMGNRNQFKPASPAIVVRILFEFFEGMSSTLIQQWKKSQSNYFVQMMEYFEKKFCMGIIKSAPDAAPLVGIINDFKNNVPDKFDTHNLDQQSADFTNGVV